jgi:glycosyltransferase involved in cell wall biosynthesis
VARTLLSVITPVFNGERFMHECIQVVVAQKCPNVEHIIVDGLSQDRTVEIIKENASKYSHIRWISEKDRGQTDAINKGIAMAGGDILGILNVDDFYEPNVLNRVRELFTNVPTPSLIVGNCNAWDDENKLLYICKPSKLKITDLLLGSEVNPHPVNPSAYFYHKSLHDIIGPYREDMGVGQDLPFLLSAVQVATVRYFDELWGNYRLIEGTLTVKEIQSGLGKKRYDFVMDYYLRQLSLGKRMQVVIRRYLHRKARKVKNRLTRISKLQDYI